MTLATSMSSDGESVSLNCTVSNEVSAILGVQFYTFVLSVPLLDVDMVVGFVKK